MSCINNIDVHKKGEQIQRCISIVYIEDMLLVLYQVYVMVQI